MAGRYQSAPEGYGPEYPQLKGLEKYRRAARDGLHNMDKFHVRAYGTAVEKAILALQKTQLRGHCINSGLHKPLCASQTPHNTGEAIHEAVKQQQLSALLSYPAKVRRARPDHVWESMYAKAMKEKREHANPKSD